MFKSLTPLSLAAMLALAVPLAAQETSTVTETEATETAQAESDTATTTDQGLDLGVPVDAGPKLGDRYSQEKHGDWDC